MTTTTCTGHWCWTDDEPDEVGFLTCRECEGMFHRSVGTRRPRTEINGHLQLVATDDPYDADLMPDEPPGTPGGDAQLLSIETRRLRVREAARRALKAESRLPVPDLIGLRDFLATPDETARYVIEDLMPVGARILLAAQYKAGKSTMTGNFIRSIADRDPFLDEHQVTLPDDAVIALIDDELDHRTLRRWLRDQGIHNVDRVALVPLRGRTSTFDITDPDVLAQWADKIAAVGARIIVLDCLRPVLDAIGLDENKEVGRFLVPFDELLGRSGASEALVIHHMGHGGERSRGDSRLRDWPDVEWTLVRENDSPHSERYFKAYGRDVDVPERALGYNSLTRHLAIVGGSRKNVAATAAVPAVLTVVRDAATPPSGRAIEAALRTLPGAEDIKQRDGRAAVTSAIEAGLLRVEKVGIARLHHLTDAGRAHLNTPTASTRQTASEPRQRVPRQCVVASYSATHTHTADEQPNRVTDALPLESA